jgi:alcohol dehydrogenase (quinone), cytochrome c subunit
MANLIKSVLLGAGVLFAAWTGGALAQTPPPDQSLVARGAYLAKAADCMPCHTSAAD